jgi:tetratricopeptide (TPR) repeat protein/TolB-like protein
MSQPSAPDLVRQRRFGHYEITEKLGAGGMGEVYRARDLTLGRAVAIKVLRGSTSRDPDRLARFEQEARSASALNHPNIVTIYEIGSADGVPYIAMELVEGKTLRQLLLEGPLLTRRALQLAAQAAGGLAQAHEASIVHRDLKPENIMVTHDGRVKILDFGLAKLVAPIADEDAITESGSLGTAPGRILGTVGYMSPEQSEGRPLDFRSDQFSCGAIFYEMTTGRPAFARPSRAHTLAAILEEDPPPIATLNPAVPPPLSWIIERCLAKNPAERYASTRDMARDLDNVLEHLSEVSPAARPPGVERAGARPMRTRALVGAGLVVLACGIGLAEWIVRSHGPARSRAGGAAVGPAGIPARRSVAVLGFRNLSGSSEANWLSTALAEMLTTELAAGGRLRTIPGENVGRMKMELSLSDAESLARDTLAKVGKNLGTDTVLLGSYLTLPEDQIRLDMRLQDVAAGETVAALAENGTQTKLVELVTRVGSRLRQSMGVGEPSPTEAAGLAAGAPSNLEAQRLYAEGLAKLRVLNALAARDMLQKAVTADPNSPMAHVALADAWTMLGYDSHAKEETQRAFDLSSSLSREERLSVEGRYRETAGEWDKAIEIYGGLLAFFPDNVEYGLRLATAQSTGGRGQDALATLDKLRNLPRRGAEDPRIDLTEAAVAQSLGDFKHEQAAASSAAAKGNAQGARLLVARARLREAYASDRLLEVSRAAVAAEEARKIYADAKDSGGLAWALSLFGNVSWDHGDIEKARTTWEECLAIRRQIGYKRGVAISRHNLGLVLKEQGDLAGARRNLEEGYAIDRELGEHSGMVFGLETLAGLFNELGDLDRAKKTGEQALALSREIGDRTEEGLVLWQLAMVLQAQGDLAGAEARYRDALPLLHERGTRDHVADTLYQLGELFRLKGDLVGARRNHEEALEIRTALRSSFAMAKSQLALARLSVDGGHAEAAEAPVQRALAVFATQKAADWSASAHAVYARSLLVRGRLADAQRASEQASALAGRSLSPHVRLTVGAITARVHAANGRTDEALKTLEMALAEATRLRLVGLQFEIRLARGEIELGAGRSSAQRTLAALANDAQAKGFGLIGAEAEALRTRPTMRGVTS